MTLSEALDACLRDPLKIMVLDEKHSFFIDSHWFDRGWLRNINGGWHPSLSITASASTDWQIKKMPASVRKYVGEKYNDPLSTKRQHK